MRNRPVRPAALRRAARLLLLAATLATAGAAGAISPLESLGEAAQAVTDPAGKALADVRAAVAAADARAAELEAEAERLRAETAGAPALSARFTEELAVVARRSMDEWEGRLPESADVDTLEALLEQERIASSQIRDRIELVTAELAQSLAQPTGGGQDEIELRQRLDALAAPVAVPEGEAPELTEARRLRNVAERRQLSAEIALQQLRQDLSGTRQRLQELELRALRHRLSLRTPRLELLQRRIAAQGRAELEAIALALVEQAKALAPEGGIAATAASGNQALGAELVQSNEQLASQRRDLVKQDDALERDLSGLRDSLSRVELGGRSEQVGTWLWAELRRLEPEDRLRDELAEVRQSLGELRLRLISLNEMQRDLANVPAAARQLRATAPGVDDDGATVETEAEDPLEALLRQRLELADRLEPLIWRRIVALEHSETSLHARIEANRELRQTLDRHLLWIRSHAPVRAAWFAQVPDGIHDLVKPSRFVTTAELFARSIREQPLRYLLSVVLVAGLLLLRRRVRPALDRLAVVMRDARQVGIRPTLEAFGWTLLGALPWATAALLLGLLLQGLGTAGKYSDSLGRAAIALALPILTMTFLHWLVRERGLAHAHFRWSRPRRDALRRWVPRLAAVLLPMYFVSTLAFIRNQELAISVQGRTAMVVASLFSAWAMWRLLAPDQLWHHRGASLEPSRLRQLLRIGLPLALLVGAGLALDGYVHSTGILFKSLFASVGMVAAVAMVHGTLSRWFVLGERRLALRRLDQRREAAAQVAAEGGEDARDGGEAIPLELEEEITLEKVSAHSRSLLRAVRVTLLVLGLVWVWAEVLPAFARFDEIVLWTIDGTGADGLPAVESITLMAVSMGLLVLALTVVAARNLPGLIEIGLLSRVGVDAASRYAITSVSRYAIVLVGVIVGLGLLGLRWGQLQWMAAALTVGLGFGLQEIFANFVSGLILLFERPFRVGDVITVNDLDGTVTRIRTRATTILDFDNKEIVVPNKAFITGQLVNWTLSDETTRITVKVGVDYGTDPQLVHRLLQQAASENARVLKEWPIRSWLLEFGASTLDFELRVFVGGMTDRLAVRDEINTRLIALFHENDIAFAYPQLDVHVRDIPETLAAARAGSERSSDDSAAAMPRARKPRAVKPAAKPRRAEREPGSDIS